MYLLVCCVVRIFLVYVYVCVVCNTIIPGPDWFTKRRACTEMIARPKFATTFVIHINIKTVINYNTTWFRRDDCQVKSVYWYVPRFLFKFKFTSLIYLFFFFFITTCVFELLKTIYLGMSPGLVVIEGIAHLNVDNFVSNSLDSLDLSLCTFSPICNKLQT